MTFEFFIFFIGVVVFVGYLANRLYFRGGQCYSTKKLVGKVAIITGSNQGIGYETALDFAYRGAHVILACRDMKKAEKAANQITILTQNKNVDVEYLDLSDLDTVRSFAKQMNEKLSKLDLLINNAGLGCCPYWKTKQGFEMTFGTNHLGHFLLTNLLLDLLKKSDSSRIVNLSSMGHYDGIINWDDINSEKSYSPLKSYSQSKLANVLFTKELVKRLKDTRITAYSVHPGAVRTDFLRNAKENKGFLGYIPAILNFFYPFLAIFLKSVKEGAQTTIHVAVSDEALQYNGCYFADCKPKKPSREALCDENATRLWKLSEQMVGL